MIWSGRSDSKSDLISLVCAQHGHLFRMKIRINLEGVSPLWAGSRLEPLASRKGVDREVRSKGSETAKIGTLGELA